MESLIITEVSSVKKRGGKMEKTHIYINLSSRKLFLKENNIVTHYFPVAVGKPSTPTPSGEFSILSKILNPGGVLGSRWMQFTRYQHGIHGTNQPWLIGKAVSLGCVRMYNKDVEVLYSKVNIGTPLTIKNYLNPADTMVEEKNINYNRKVYTVRNDDSLWKIAKKFNTTIHHLKELNNLIENKIYPGQTLYIS